MSDVCACCKHNRIALGLLVVIVNQLGNIKHLVEKRHPAVVVRVMLSNFLRDVVVAQLVGSRVALGLVLFKAFSFLGSGRWNSRSHLI